MGKKRAIASRKGAAAAAQTVNGRNDSFEALFLGFSLQLAVKEKLG